MSFMKEIEHLRIPFQDIEEATKNFTTQIGRGGYGPVYRGELSVSEKLTAVAVKRLQTDHRFGQGLKEFLTEIQLLSRYKHKNIVSFVGFCEERNEKFLIYKYAERGSLDNYLKPSKNRPPLTWKQRIRVCVDGARGLDHLHNHVAQNERVIHRDIKSANILIDHNWKAMIADFGLSKIGRANENVTYLISNVCGTLGYFDPTYFRTGILTKKSDVYSFGVVLVEVLCGRLCFIKVNSTEPLLAPLAQSYYQDKKLNLIIDPGLKNYINSDSMKIFSEIAFQCLQDDREQRPSMGLVLEKLEKVLELLEKEEAPELLELEEALELKKLVETLQMQQFEEAWMHEFEESLGLLKLVETSQRHKFEESLGLLKLVETLQRHEAHSNKIVQDKNTRASTESSTHSFRNPKSSDVITANRGNLVAKLMGLDAFLDSASPMQKESGLAPIRTSRVKKLGSDMKPISRFPIEPAPRKQRDGTRASKSPTKLHSSYSSVYSEVDKRLKDPESTQSGKDLRALKQILEAMQSKELLNSMPILK